MATDLDQLKQKWFVRTPDELRARRAELGGADFLIDGLFPTQSLGIVVGDSGLGKSPLLYQAALCVAAGVPFLGHQTRQSRVLYLDFENSVGESAQIVTRLAEYLGVSNDPQDLLVWNASDCSPDWGQGGHGALSCILDVKPALAIIDSLGSYAPEVEEKNSNAGQAYKRLRQVMRMAQTAIIVIHHRKKPNGDGQESLDSGNPRRWFLQARGASSLINGSDVRLGVDEPSGTCRVLKKKSGDKGKTDPIDPLDCPEDWGAALVMRGFARVRGEIPLTYLTRMLDPEGGEPLGYARMTGVKLLFNQDQEECFAQLPDSFAFKDARRAYGRHDEATRGFMKKCISVGILYQPGRGLYEKVKSAE